MSVCGERCEVWSRVVGYFRPVHSWNKGKKEEFKERQTFQVQKSGCNCCASDKKDEKASC